MTLNWQVKKTRQIGNTGYLHIHHNFVKKSYTVLPVTVTRLRREPDLSLKIGPRIGPKPKRLSKPNLIKSFANIVEMRVYTMSVIIAVNLVSQ